MTIRTATCRLRSITQYSQSRRHEVPFLDNGKEAKDAYEQRTWREKCTTDEQGIVCINAMAMKDALDAAARRLGLKIPGKGNSTYTKHIEAGIVIQPDMIPLGIHKKDVPSITLWCDAKGKRGKNATSQVKRIFPLIPKWEVTVQFLLLDPVIDEEIFKKHLEEAGLYVGIGRGRAEKGRGNGRWEIVDIKWS